MVVVHQWWRKYVPGDEEDMDPFSKYETLQPLVTSAGAKLVLVSDVPGLPTLGEYCVPSPWSPDAGSRCRFRWQGSGQALALGRDEATFHRMAADNSTFYMPIYQYLCDGPLDGSAEQICGANVPGTSTLAFFDEQHLTTAGALYLWPYLCSFFVDAGLLGSW